MSGDRAPREPSDQVIRRVLADCDVWAVVGLSTNNARAAYGVARFLVDHGKQVIPVHPAAETVHGERGYARLADIGVPVDCVDVFVRSELAGEIVDEAMEIGASAVWMQLGVVDHAAAARAQAAGLDVVMDRCPAIEWPRLGPAA
jgi:predicted CoA-binding protein